MGCLTNGLCRTKNRPRFHTNFDQEGVCVFVAGCPEQPLFFNLSRTVTSDGNRDLRPSLPRSHPGKVFAQVVW